MAREGAYFAAAEYKSSPAVEEKGTLSYLRRTCAYASANPEVQAKLASASSSGRKELADAYLKKREKWVSKRRHHHGLQASVAEGSWRATQELRRRAESDPKVVDSLASVTVAESLDQAPPRRHWAKFVVTPKGFADVAEDRIATGRTHRQREEQMSAVWEHPGALVGRTAMRVGDRPAKFTDAAGRPWDHALQATGWREKLNFPVVLMTASGSFQTCRQQLVKNAAPSVGDARCHEMMDMVALAGNALKFRIVHWPRRSAVSHARVNPLASPGLLTGAVYATRANAFEATTAEALRVWDALMEREGACATPWGPGGREKRQERTLGDEVKSRLVQAPEDALARLEGVVAQPLTKMVMEVCGELHVGFSLAHGRYRELVDRMAECEHVKALDWSSYDACLPWTAVIVSFSVLRACYPASVHTDRVFAYLASAWRRRVVIAPGGDVVCLIRGVPSGSGFTSLIGSVANWLVNRTVVMRLRGPKVAKSLALAICGDDQLQGYPDGRRAPSTEVFLRETKRAFGLDAGDPPKGEAREGFHQSSDPLQCLPFLGYRVSNGLPFESARDFAICAASSPRQPRSIWALGLRTCGAVGDPLFGPGASEMIGAVNRWAIANAPDLGAPDGAAEFADWNRMDHSAAVYLGTKELTPSQAADWTGKSSPWHEWRTIEKDRRVAHGVTPGEQTAAEKGASAEWECLRDHLFVEVDPAHSGPPYAASSWAYTEASSSGPPPITPAQAPPSPRASAAPVSRATRAWIERARERVRKAARALVAACCPCCTGVG